jgi:hypothetical protein
MIFVEEEKSPKKDESIRISGGSMISASPPAPAA